jgi:folate-binding protein YgfZ
MTVDLGASTGWRATPRDIVLVSGRDAIDYLQGQLSQDVASLAVGDSARSFVLAPAGKVDAWVRATRTAGDEVLLDVDAGAGEALAARLRRFLLRTEADIAPLAWQCVALRGPGAREVGQRAAAAQEGVLAVPAGWPGIEGVDLLGPVVAAPDGVPQVDAAAYEAARIRAGVPAMGAELTEATIPAEAGQWVVDASVSFTKGCFTGQELVARIDSRGGNVPRRLRRLESSGPPLPAGAPVVVDGTEVGTVTSGSASTDGGAVALAYVRRVVEPPAAAGVGAGADLVPVTVVAVPPAG